MPSGMQAAKEPALYEATAGTNEDRRQDYRAPEAQKVAESESCVGAQHVQARMREVHDPHQAEDQSQTGSQHKQQESVCDAV